MNFVRWMAKPHFPPLSLIAAWAGPFTLGWFHLWLWFLVYIPIALGGEYFFAAKTEPLRPQK